MSDRRSNSRRMFIRYRRYFTLYPLISNAAPKPFTILQSNLEYIHLLHSYPSSQKILSLVYKAFSLNVPGICEVCRRQIWAQPKAKPHIHLLSDPKGKVRSTAECPSPLILNFYHPSLFSLLLCICLIIPSIKFILGTLFI